MLTQMHVSRNILLNGVSIIPRTLKLAPVFASWSQGATPSFHNLPKHIMAVKVRGTLYSRVDVIHGRHILQGLQHI